MSQRSTKTVTPGPLPPKPRTRANRSPRPTDSPVAASRPTADAINQRAYEIFLARGGSSGDPVADWLQAERELTLTMMGA